MSKFVRKLTAVVLLAVMVTGLAAMVSADKPEKATLVCIGDSVAAGFGMNSDDTDNPMNAPMLGGEDFSMNQTVRGLLFYGYNNRIGLQKCVADTFGQQVADRLGYEYVDMTCCGIRLADVYGMLTEDACPSGGFMPTEETMGELKGLTGEDRDTPVVTFYGNAMREEIRNASLVVLFLGTNDVLMAPFLADDPDSITQAQIRLTKTLPKLLQKIRSINPDCEVQLLGFYNPLETVSLTALNERALSTASSAIAFINSQYALAAKANGVTYVDISGTGRCLDDMVLNFDQDIGDAFVELIATHIHPNQAGHDYIASRILKKLAVGLRQGTLITYLGDENVGELIYRRTGLGWVIQKTDGSFLNCDGETVSTGDRATVWKHLGGFYITRTEKGFLGINKRVKMYLASDQKGGFKLVSEKTETTFYEAD